MPENMPPTFRRLGAAVELAKRPATEGERSAALLAVGRLIVSKWDDEFADCLAAGPRRNIPPPPSAPSPSDSAEKKTVIIHDRHELVRRIAAQPWRLSEWEAGFIANIRSRRRITTRQTVVLHKLAGRCGIQWVCP